MALSASEIAGQLSKLLPFGAAWSRAIGSTMQALLLAAGDELARLYGRAEDLLREAHSETIDETLEEWEHELGLPAPCVTAAQTIDERRAAVAAKRLAVGGQSRQYFIDVAGGLGLEITIEEHQPFYVGIHGCGDPVGEIEWKFTWTVHAPAADTTAERQQLECTLDSLRPAHTRVFFVYE